ncbi:MAG: TPM domain-containing protein [Ardenticatenales bacterium]|nr:TPM domain-containing protein [Ardenticatenales bacterium]
MQLATAYFSEEEQRAIAAAIAEAEAQTAAEIVPVVATVSGRYDRAESIFGFLFALSCLAVAWLGFQEIRPVENDWAGGYQFGLNLTAIILILVMTYIVGVIAATYLPILRRPFISRQEMAAEVAEAAQAAFYQFRVHRTAAGTGLVIYLSLYERQVQILGDESLDDVLSQAEWDALRDLVVSGLREGHGADGLIAAIRRCGELLAAPVPVAAGDRNELHNELQFIE